MVTVTLSSVTERFDDSDYVAKKALSAFLLRCWHANCKGYGIHLSVNNVANIYDVKKVTLGAVLMSRVSPFCSSCIHV